MHGGERDGEGGGFLEIHVRGRAEQPAVIGQRIFGKRRAARAHDLVADLDAFGVGAELGDFARPFHAEHGADAAGRAMHMALGHAEIGAVEAAGMDLDQHLRALRRRFCDVGDFGAVGAVDIGFHGLFSFVARLIPLAGEGGVSVLRESILFVCEALARCFASTSPASAER